MKNKTKYLLQRILGFERYLRVFSRFKIATLKSDKKEKDFFVFMNLLNNPENILDLGANIGVMTVHLAENFPQATIHAVEPLQTNMEVLKYSVEKSKLNNVKMYQTALGDSICNVEMILPNDGATRLHGLSHVVHDSITDWNEGERFQVPCTTVDHLFDTMKIDGIKIDVENFEYFVLLGATEVISNQRPIIYAELWDNENRINCFQFMLDRKYAIYCVVDGQLKPWEKGIETQNFIFICD